MVAYTKPQQMKTEESERLRGERETRSSYLSIDLKDGKLQDRVSHVEERPRSSIQSPTNLPLNAR